MSGSTSISSTRKASASVQRRRVPIGAEYLGGGRTHARVWAPRVEHVECVLENAHPWGSRAGFGGPPDISGARSAQNLAPRIGLRLRTPEHRTPDPPSGSN